MGFEVEGFDELEKELQELSERAEALEGEQEVPLEDLLTESFLRRHSEFASLEEMFEDSGWKVETPEDFESIPAEDWDSFISANSKFTNWDEMLSAAGEEWAARQLGLDR